MISRAGFAVLKKLKTGQSAIGKRQFGDYVRYSNLVADALRTHRPIVALESTILTHGMPYPENLETALEVEKTVRDNGAVPATIAILQGKVHIGLTEEEITSLAKSKKETIKTSRRDIPYVLSRDVDGGTTVSGTMLAARKVGLPIFVTGGIGGVHRDGENSMDISADLTELGRTPVAVISAGVKSILDICKTLEYLETEGVCVATYGPSNELPAFYSAHSGCTSPYNVANPVEAAKLIDAMLNFELGSGLLIGVPIPEDQAADGAVIERAVQLALQEATERDIQGRDVTPFVLQRVNEITNGLSLRANIALIKNNAKVGAQIACELQDIRNQSYAAKLGHRPYHFTHVVNAPAYGHRQHNQAVVIGGTNIDLTCTFTVDDVEENGATYPGTVQQSFGGVGRNIADCLTRLGADPLLISAVGNDTQAENLYHHCSHMNLQGVKKCEELSTAVYSAILRYSGEVIYGIGDFNVHAEITPDYVSRFEQNLMLAPLVVMDGNIPADTMAYVCDVCKDKEIPVWFEPTDLRLVDKLFTGDMWQSLTYISPNMNELRILHDRVTHLMPSSLEKVKKISYEASDDQELCQTIDEAVHIVQPLLHVFPNIMVTMGQHGVLICRNTAADTPFQVAGADTHEAGLSIIHYPVRKAGTGLASIVSVSGAGDCLAATMIWRIMMYRSPVECVTTGLVAAQKSLRSHEAVPGTISPEALSRDAVQNWMHMYCSPVTVV